MTRNGQRAEATKYLLLALALPAAFLGPAGAGDQSDRVVSRAPVCMRQNSVQPKDGLPNEYGTKTYYLCCRDGKPAFPADPERYLRTAGTLATGGS